ncbi:MULTISPECIES: hypothetical protein [Methylobacterium]|uniref:Uncharacterized protein n=1 Tax=Methylobacterium longum TaxID=767694 RepID=A0ABT8AWN3_9HYPH|nr:MULTISPECIES: hypothetical protein [Methylobacterium]MCJ2098316.1 hypothetical protein [Methylobacterium sp. E-046]MDN3574155.1 hypothetical protein [Methylobacterium longum]
MEVAGHRGLSGSAGCVRVDPPAATVGRAASPVLRDAGERHRCRPGPLAKSLSGREGKSKTPFIDKGRPSIEDRRGETVEDRIIPVRNTCIDRA